MQIRFALVFGLLISVLAVRAEEKIPWLRAGIDSYTNVTVTSVSATDIFFTHSRGVGNAKLKDLSPALQQRFHFNAGKAADAMTQQAQANAQYRSTAAAQKPVAKPPETKAKASEEITDADIQVPQLYAKS